MFSHIPRSSRIFIGLAIITLLTTYLAMALTEQQNRIFAIENRRTPRSHMEPTRKLVDTKDWQTYIDTTYPITFQYPKDWKIKANAANKDHFDIELTIPNSASMHIYISDTYNAPTGTQRQKYTVDHVSGILTANNFVNLRTGEYYYTFDGTQIPQLTDEFNTVLSTVKFQ